MADVARLLISRWKADENLDRLFISAMVVVVLPFSVFFVAGVWLLLKAIWVDYTTDDTDYHTAQKQLVEIDPSYQYCVGDLNTTAPRSCNIVVRIGKVGNWQYELKHGCTEEERLACVAIRRGMDALKQQ